MMTRRQAIKTTALAAAATTVNVAISQTNPPTVAASPFTLPPLPYALDALEPHIDARTMEIHHSKHHKAYVDNLNKAIADHPTLAAKSIEDLLKELNSNAVPEKIRALVRNNGGGHHNHTLFWQMMKKNGGGEPKSELAAAIDKKFGNFSGFKTKFTESAMKVFGSGWAWLVIHEGALNIVSMPNQNSPISPDVLPSEVHDSSGKNLTFIHPSQQPLLGLDVWEHAYYLNYQNKRADYIAAWWNVVNWDFVAQRYAALK
jgi:Fe-Mn family superoxide dismutase